MAPRASQKIVAKRPVGGAKQMALATQSTTPKRRQKIVPKRPVLFTRAKSRMLAQSLLEQTKANNKNYDAVRQIFFSSLRARPGAALHSAPGASTLQSTIMKGIYEGGKYLMRIHKDNRIGNCIVVFGQLHSTCMTLDSVEAACEQAGRILNMTIERMLDADIMYALPDMKLHDHIPTAKGNTLYEAWVPVNVEAPVQIQMGDLQRVAECFGA